MSLKIFRRGLHGDSLLGTLKSRGLISQVSSEYFGSVAENEKLGVYLGADPSADSLHLGNLMPFMVLMHFYLRGHKVFPLIGGATGFVGDPSGRKTERSAMMQKEMNRNISQIQNQMVQVLSNCRTVAAKYDVQLDSISSLSPEGNVVPVNNHDWWNGMGMLQFLGTYGRHIRVSSMLARESVKQRLGSEAGIGYNEFSYQILQAYDFYHLYKNMSCRCQIGGQDQWGNITAGIDLINRLRDSKNDPEPFGLTVPLLTTSSGEKFGKSAGNAVFLSAERTRPYHLYQYLVKCADDEVENYLKVFTFIPLKDIDSLMGDHWARPEARLAQKRLASEVTELVHGPSLAQSAEVVTAVFFGDLQPTAKTLLDAFRSQDLVYGIEKKSLLAMNWKNLIAEISNRSKSESQRLLKNGAIYVGLDRDPVTSHTVEESQLTEEMALLIRVGKTEYYVVEAL